MILGVEFTNSDPATEAISNAHQHLRVSEILAFVSDAYKKLINDVTQSGES